MPSFKMVLRALVFLFFLAPSLVYANADSPGFEVDATGGVAGFSTGKLLGSTNDNSTTSYQSNQEFSGVEAGYNIVLSRDVPEEGGETGAESELEVGFGWRNIDMGTETTVQSLSSLGETETITDNSSAQVGNYYTFLKYIQRFDLRNAVFLKMGIGYDQLAGTELLSVYNSSTGYSYYDDNETSSGVQVDLTLGYDLSIFRWLNFDVSAGYGVIDFNNISNGSTTTQPGVVLDGLMLSAGYNIKF